MAYTYSKIGTYSVGSGGIGSVSFINIPQNYTDLKISCSVRNETVAGQLGIIFNGSTSSVYNRIKLYTDGVNMASPNGFNESFYNYVDIPFSSYTANVFGSVDIYIPRYSIDGFKNFSVDSVEGNATATSYVEIHAGLFSNSEPIRSVRFIINDGSEFNQYSTFHLYGIKAEV